mmetsp:Transcript_51362/g.164206  ORF Transcript_51362/g.164206 Transcript_51362/m.164206 type:complete len:423 (-) Transcript_51362:32-1300(-)
MRFSVDCELDMDVDLFWAERTSPAFLSLQAEFLKLAVAEVMSNTVDGGVMTTKLRTIPDLKLPYMVKSYLNGSDVEFIDTLQFPAQASAPYEARFTTVNNITERTEVGGLLRVERIGEGRCRQSLQGDCIVKLAGVGGVIERIIVGELQKTYQQLPALVEQWLIVRESHMDDAALKVAAGPEAGPARGGDAEALPSGGDIRHAGGSGNVPDDLREWAAQKGLVREVPTQSQGWASSFFPAWSSPMPARADSIVEDRATRTDSEYFSAGEDDRDDAVSLTGSAAGSLADGGAGRKLSSPVKLGTKSPGKKVAQAVLRSRQKEGYRSIGEGQDSVMWSNPLSNGSPEAEEQSGREASNAALNINGGGMANGHARKNGHANGHGPRPGVGRRIRMLAGQLFDRMGACFGMRKQGEGRGDAYSAVQ